jgi:O-antigen/teichoic acid export membrane protein
MELSSTLERTLNIGLRTGTLCTRFLFVFFVARYLEPEMVGKYGIFTATVGFLILAVGLDYYTFTSRELLSLQASQRGRLLKGHVALTGLLYLAVLPIAVILLSISGWPGDLLFWLIPIVILEHFNQEVFRLLIVLNNQIYASIALFLRQGSWAIVVVGILIAWEGSRHLHTVFAFWTSSSLAAAAFGYWKVKQGNLGGWKQPIDWGLIRKGTGVSIGLLIGTLAIRAIHTTDRYWLEALGGHEILAAYVLYFGVASALLTFLDAGVFSYTYPKLIQYFHQNDSDLASDLIKRALLQTTAFCVAFAIASWLILPYLLLWIDKPVYYAKINIYPWLLSATILNSVSMIPHYALYARGMNRHIIFSHIAALVTFTCSVWALSDAFSEMSVLYALNASFIVVLVIKTAAYFNSNP